MNPAGKLDVGQTCISLKFIKNLQIDDVKVFCALIHYLFRIKCHKSPNNA